MAQLRWQPNVVGADSEDLRLCGEALLDDAKALAPELSGDLKRSGFVRVEGDAVKIGFGAEYAVKQHYRQDFEHPRGGEVFFLMKAVEEFGPVVEQILAEQLRRRLGG
ncbi:hypothetical protein HYG77_04765 [Rhodococcus sp. ZPP]|uniref:hypothetical protein n=1 Tax=Rhodococcus sp. ZPP TaxID=2749906 RepID=UPI001AD86123|nr:hypothetical protein [Rhodococcus sp. ZPP]QTJ64977.1 hypothetical protein HYG77_04765 [Rhodococcus sp. ZPP]